MNLERLKDPFPADEIEWRVSRAGTKTSGEVWAKILAYVTNRAIMNRLDEVCGPENWKNSLQTWQGDKAVLCGISIRLHGEWVEKWDVAENTDIEPVKGGVSGAGKRAGVQWGIGRYLYNLEETWANINEKGKFAGQYKSSDGKTHFFRYDPPPLPAWALPAYIHADKSKADPAVIETLRSCESMEQLQTVWKSLSQEQRDACTSVKDEMKSKLSDGR